ncbi:conserved hypothetical protein [Trichinella spiralis]|uniref:hypothetical protein n=1 Tax=Trichinella spiralis TaxID=6334 RepID=UPI0001EFBF1D|nr:conserved hypothetical protein [Trichinella spiralis]
MNTSKFYTKTVISIGIRTAFDTIYQLNWITKNMHLLCHKQIKKNKQRLNLAAYIVTAASVEKAEKTAAAIGVQFFFCWLIAQLFAFQKQQRHQYWYWNETRNRQSPACKCHFLKPQLDSNQQKK